MRQDITDLKKTVGDMMCSQNASEPLKSHVEATSPIQSVPALIPQQLRRVSESSFSKEVNDENINVEELEDTLSLDEVEREMIMKALNKHRGKRKDAAHDLNISERTLYRKIKEYGLDK